MPQVIRPFSGWHDQALIASLKKEVLKMEESITYQEIVGIGEARGRAVEARRMLITIGQSRLGLPTRRVKKALDSILEPERLEALGGRLLEVKSWNELLEEI